MRERHEMAKLTLGFRQQQMVVFMPSHGLHRCGSGNVLSSWSTASRRTFTIPPDSLRNPWLSVCGHLLFRGQETNQQTNKQMNTTRGSARAGGTNLSPARSRPSDADRHRAAECLFRALFGARCDGIDACTPLSAKNGLCSLRLCAVVRSTRGRGAAARRGGEALRSGQKHTSKIITNVHEIHAARAGALALLTFSTNLHDGER